MAVGVVTRSLLLPCPCEWRHSSHGRPQQHSDQTTTDNAQACTCEVCARRYFADNKPFSKFRWRIGCVAQSFSVQFVIYVIVVWLALMNAAGYDE